MDSGRSFTSISALAWSGDRRWTRWSPTRADCWRKIDAPLFKSGGSSPAHQVPKGPSRPRPVVIEREETPRLSLFMDDVLVGLRGRKQDEEKSG